MASPNTIRQQAESKRADEVRYRLAHPKGLVNRQNRRHLPKEG